MHSAASCADERGASNTDDASDTSMCRHDASDKVEAATQWHNTCDREHLGSPHRTSSRLTAHHRIPTYCPLRACGLLRYHLGTTEAPSLPTGTRQLAQRILPQSVRSANPTSRPRTPSARRTCGSLPPCPPRSATRYLPHLTSTFLSSPHPISPRLPSTQLASPHLTSPTS